MSFIRSALYQRVLYSEYPLSEGPLFGVPYIRGSFIRSALYQRVLYSECPLSEGPLLGMPFIRGSFIRSVIRSALYQRVLYGGLGLIRYTTQPSGLESPDYFPFT